MPTTAGLSQAAVFRFAANSADPRAGRQAGWFSAGLRTWIVTGIVLLNVLVALLGWNYLQSARRSAHERAATATGNLAQLIERDVTATLDRLDVTLQSVSGQLERQLAAGGVDRRQLWPLVDDALALAPPGSHIGIFDAEGAQVCGAGSARCRYLNIADRDYFRQARDGADHRTLLSGPLQRRTDGLWSLFLTRALRRADGSFAGVAVAILPLETLRKGFAALDLGPNGAVSLRHESLTLLARHPGPMRMAREEDNRRVSAQLAAALRDQPRGGTYEAPTAIDGIERVNAYRRFDRYPLYILVGLGKADFLDPWQRSLGGAAVLGLAFAGLTAALAAFLLSAVRQLVDGEARIRGILASVTEGVVFHDREGRVVDANPAAAALLGLTRSQLLELRAMDPRWRAIDEDGSAFDARTHPVRVSLATGRSVRDRVVGLHIPGRGLRWLSINAQAQFLPGQAGPSGAVASITDITERRAAEARLRAKEALFRGLFDQSVFLATVLDEQARVLEVNEPTLRVLGAGRDQVVGQPFGALACWAGSPERSRLDEVLAAAAAGRAGSFETRLTLHGGGGMAVLFTAMPESLPDGLRIAVIGVDITERQQARDALADSERRLRMASDAGQVGVWELDPASGKAWRSQRHARIFGYEDAQGDWGLAQLLKHVVEADREQVRQSIERGRSTGAMAYQCRIVRADGAARWIAVRGEALRDADGTPQRLLGTVQDITEQCKREDELRVNGEVLRTMREGVCLVQPGSGRIVYANPRMAAMFGYAVGELEGLPVSRLNAPTQRTPEAVAAEISAVLARCGAWEGDVHNLRKDGTAFWCRASVSTLRLEQQGEVWVSVLQDITERKRAEAALADANAQLQALALHDPLTGLFNRRYMDEAVRAHAAEALREGHALSFVLLDIDHFKRVNDRHGHAAGDAVLAALGGLLMAACRASDVACRYGGEEFLLVLPRMDEAQALARAEEIRARAQALRVELAGAELRVTVSVGVATFPRAADSVEGTIAAADRALYDAKRGGRNAVRLAAD